MSLALLLPAALLLGCSNEPASADKAAAPDAQAPADTPADTPADVTDKPDIVIVTLDTTRADRLGAYGHTEAATDWIDAQAAQGVRFDRAYAVQPLTIPAHSSIFTGLWPWHHGVRSNGDAVLSEDNITLAERLGEAGWQTAASVSAFVTTRTWGFDQGFDAYFDEVHGRAADAWHQERPAGPVVDDAISWVKGAKDDAPIFLWVHLYDAHFPYSPPDDYAEEYAERPYDGEIAYVDDQLQRLDAAMQAEGRDPVYVLIGDHGESLGEHRELTHGLFVYDATQHIPFIISGPGIDPAVVEQPVSQVDLVPTLMKLIGQPVPEGLDGKVQPGNPHPVWMESFQLTELFDMAPHTAIVDGDMKLIHKPRPELYQLIDDPVERQDLAATRPEEITRLTAVLEGMEPEMPSGKTQALDPAALAQLQALGYVATSSFDVEFAELPDPADHRDVIGKVLRADVLASKGERAEGIRLLEEAIAAKEDVAQIHLRLARLQANNGDRDGALATLDRAIATFPDDVDLLLRAASTMGRFGMDERSLELARQALAQEPDNARAAEFVAGALINLGRQPEMLTFTKTWLEEYPDTPTIAALRGIILFDAGQLAEGEKMLRAAAEDPRPRAGVYQRMGALALAAGHPDDAERWLQQELDLYGTGPMTARLLVSAYAQQGRHTDVISTAEAYYDRKVQTPGGPEAPEELKELRHAQAIALFELGRVDEARQIVDTGLAAFPDDPDMLLMLANIQHKQGEEEAALATKVKADAAHAARVEAMKAARAKAAGGE